MLILHIQIFSISKQQARLHILKLAILFSDVESGTLLDLFDLPHDFLLRSITGDSHLLVEEVDNDLINSYTCKDQ